MLLPSEWSQLKAATECGPSRYGMTGPERAMLYCVAIATGLRANELRSLTRSSIKLDGAQPRIVVMASETKNSKLVQQFIDGVLASELHDFVGAQAASATLFPMPDRTKLAPMLRHDLQNARTAWLAAAADDDRVRREKTDFLAATNQSGAGLDFHSLRHTCGAWASQMGAHPKAVQRLMRHSTIALTMDTYGHLLPGQETDTACRVGQLLHVESHDPNGATRRAVPTDFTQSCAAQGTPNDATAREVLGGEKTNHRQLKPRRKAMRGKKLC